MAPAKTKVTRSPKQSQTRNVLLIGSAVAIVLSIGAFVALNLVKQSTDDRAAAAQQLQFKYLPLCEDLYEKYPDIVCQKQTGTRIIGSKTCRVEETNQIQQCCAYGVESKGTGTFAAVAARCKAQKREPVGQTEPLRPNATIDGTTGSQDGGMLRRAPGPGYTAPANDSVLPFDLPTSGLDE